MATAERRHLSDAPPDFTFRAPDYATLDRKIATDERNARERHVRGVESKYEWVVFDDVAAREYRAIPRLETPPATPRNRETENHSDKSDSNRRSRDRLRAEVTKHFVRHALVEDLSLTYDDRHLPAGPDDHDRAMAHIDELFDKLVRRVGAFPHFVDPSHNLDRGDDHRLHIHAAVPKGWSAANLDTVQILWPYGTVSVEDSNSAARKHGRLSTEDHARRLAAYAVRQIEAEKKAYPKTKLYRRSRHTPLPAPERHTRSSFEEVVDLTQRLAGGAPLYRRNLKVGVAFTYSGDRTDQSPTTGSDTSQEPTHSADRSPSDTVSVTPLAPDLPQERPKHSEWPGGAPMASKSSEGTRSGPGEITCRALPARSRPWTPARRIWRGLISHFRLSKKPRSP